MNIVADFNNCLTLADGGIANLPVECSASVVKYFS